MSPVVRCTRGFHQIFQNPRVVGRSLLHANQRVAYNELGRAAEATAQDAWLVLRLQATDEAAYDELVRTYHRSLFQVACRMLVDSAEAADVVQDIFLKVFRHISGFKGEAALKIWIFRIAFSEIFNRLRW